MTSTITIQVEDKSGLDSRLFFPGLFIVGNPQGEFAKDGTSGSQHYMINGHQYDLSASGSGIAPTASFQHDLQGVVTSLTLQGTISGDFSDLATMTVSLDAVGGKFGGLPINSFLELTQDSLLNPLASATDVSFQLLGNIGDDKLYGSDYSDRLVGGGGHDLLTGYGGADTFVFNSAGEATADHVTDFKHLTDTIEINGDAMTGIKVKSLDTEFHDITKGGMQSEDANDRLLYNQHSGDLYYDKDGDKAHGEKPQLIATFDNHAHIDIRDLSIFL